MSTATPQPPSDAKQRLLAARRALYRETIIGAAERVFAEHGYEAAKIAAIAKEAGLSLQTLYGVFPKKWDVYRAVQADRLSALMLEVGRAVMAADDAFMRLRCGLEGYLRFHMARPDFLRMQLRERIPWGTTDLQGTPEQTQAWEMGLKMMTAAFVEGTAAGFFVETDPELAARTATAMSQVHLSMWIDRGMPQSPDVVAHEAMAQIVRTFARTDRVEELTARLVA
ncbi:MAG: TetR/AcrR family transcriptional regulator [Nannocystaceae bacterium]|nr:TetR/AcrR family transcriptional regulator [Nannocystaceae bacterium]